MPTSIAIGTPYQSNAIRVLMLGAGELGKEVAISLQRLGVEVHAADRYANAPAMQVAHASHVLAMTDADALLKLIEHVKPHIIVPEIEAIATHVLLEIESTGLATVIPTARAVNLTMNREGIRRLAAEELKLPTSPYRFAHTLDEFTNACMQIGFPCFVKPTMSSSGKGQSRLTHSDQINAAWDYAIQSGRVHQHSVIIEGQIDFDYEITLLTVRYRDADHGQIATCFCDPIGHRQEHGDYVESWQPQPMNAAALTQAKIIAKQVTEALSGLGVFGIELFIKGDMVWFSEVSPRPHDTGLVTLASQFQSEFELHARAILGLPVDPSRHSIAASSVIYANTEGEGLCYNHLDIALAIPDSDIRLFAKPNATAKRRMGVATARAASVDEARQKATRCAASVQINKT